MKLLQYIVLTGILTGTLFACQDASTSDQKIQNPPTQVVEASILPDFLPNNDSIPMAEKILDVWEIVSYKLGEKDLPMERYKDATIEFTTEGRIKSSFRTREEMYRIEGNRLIYPNRPEKKATLQDLGNGQIAVLAQDKNGQLARMVLERVNK